MRPGGFVPSTWMELGAAQVLNKPLDENVVRDILAKLLPS
jgi:hypothetical protein